MDLQIIKQEIQGITIQQNPPLAAYESLANRMLEVLTDDSIQVNSNDDSIRVKTTQDMVKWINDHVEDHRLAGNKPHREAINENDKAHKSPIFTALVMWYGKMENTRKAFQRREL
jgi:hypothetical protein